MGLAKMVTRYPVWDVSYDVAVIFTLGRSSFPLLFRLLLPLSGGAVTEQQPQPPDTKSTTNPPQARSSGLSTASSCGFLSPRPRQSSPAKPS